MPCRKREGGRGLRPKITQILPPYPLGGGPDALPPRSSDGWQHSTGSGQRLCSCHRSSNQATTTSTHTTRATRAGWLSLFAYLGALGAQPVNLNGGGTAPANRAIFRRSRARWCCASAPHTTKAARDQAHRLSPSERGTDTTRATRAGWLSLFVYLVRSALGPLTSTAAALYINASIYAPLLVPASLASCSRRAKASGLILKVSDPFTLAPSRFRPAPSLAPPCFDLLFSIALYIFVASIPKGRGFRPTRRAYRVTSHFIRIFQIFNEICSFIVLFVWDCCAYSFVRCSASPRALSRNRNTKIFIYFVFAKLFQEKK